MRLILSALLLTGVFIAPVAWAEERAPEERSSATRERSSNRGLIKLGVGLVLLVAGGGAAALSKRQPYKRPTNRTKPGSAPGADGTRKPLLKRPPPKLK